MPLRHGLVCITEDVDPLVEATEENCHRVTWSLSVLVDGTAAELCPSDVMQSWRMR